MAGLIWLEDSTPLPAPIYASPEGLLAAGASLTLERLTEAYTNGIFPWFNPGDPVLWWSPDPRMLLACADFKISRSLAKKLRQIARIEQQPDARMYITTDTAFAEVIAACAAPRDGRPDTWISPQMQAAYLAWHHAGVAHSVETWMDGELVGGIYGVNLGGFFFGESMFSRRSNASKIALAYLVRFLLTRGVQHIDCQQETSHLASLGAAPVSRRRFMAVLGSALKTPAAPWPCGRLLHTGSLARGWPITP
jgi:leucyl/phenylalanyl-tRNA--protein transferase